MQADIEVLSWTTQRGKQLGLDTEELKELQRLATPYCKMLARIRALGSPAGKASKHIATQALASFGGMLSAVVRTIKPNASEKVTLKLLKERAQGVAPLAFIPERVRLTFLAKSDGSFRPIYSFGPRRRAAQQVCRDILDAQLPTYSFFYPLVGRGKEKAIKSLINLIETDGATHVVVADVQNCFGSPIKNKLSDLLALPGRAVRHTLLIAENVQLAVEHNDGEGEHNEPNVIYTTPNEMGTNGAALQGLPQGSLASGMIMYRAVLGPALDALPFSKSLVQFGDDIAVCSGGSSDAKAVLDALQSSLSTSPAGPLSIGKVAISSIAEGIDFLGYRITLRNGSFRFRPSRRSYLRAAQKARIRYLTAGGGDEGSKAVDNYSDHWISSFPLWNSPASTIADARMYLRCRACQ